MVLCVIVSRGEELSASYVPAELVPYPNKMINVLGKNTRVVGVCQVFGKSEMHMEIECE